MFDPSPSNTANTLTEVLGWIREISIIGIIVGAAWKARGLFDDLVKFWERVEEHMTKMENFAETVMENHLEHLQKTLDRLADEKEREENDRN